MGMRSAFAEELCTNCHLCSIFCSLAFTKNGIFEFRPSIARIRTVENEDETKGRSFFFGKMRSYAMLRQRQNNWLWDYALACFYPDYLRKLDRFL